MPIVQSYPNKHVPILQSDTVDQTQVDSQGTSQIVNLLPLIDGTITLRLQDDSTSDFPNGVAYPVIAGVPIIGRVIRVFATGTDLTNAQMVGRLISR